MGSLIGTVTIVDYIGMDWCRKLLRHQSIPTQLDCVRNPVIYIIKKPNPNLNLNPNPNLAILDTALPNALSVLVV